MRLAPENIRVRSLAGAVVGAMLATFLAEPQLDSGFVERIDQALAGLESGFR
jgi:hypothetical protein